MPHPGNRSLHLLLTSVLALLVIAAIAAYNADYLFHTHLYETADAGANSLSIWRAGRFQELYGPYSRWRFHHPGPAIFYFSALMEAICCSWLRVMPTPYNAQMLATIILSFGFLIAGLGVAARWVRSAYFVPLALVLAVLHFTSIDLRFLFTATWPACVVPLIFFCLLMAATSVAAGEGRDLPLLVTAGSLLVHTHVAQPLFVLPMFTLAYLGLSWTCYRSVRAAGTPAGAALPSAPWRMFPRAHGFAGVLAVLFVLPLMVDLLKGSQSNFALILLHQRAPHDPPHAWLDAIFYFIRFGTYRANLLGGIMPRGGGSYGAIGRYVTSHLEMALLWGAALLSPLLALLLHRLVPARLPGPAAASNQRPPAVSTTPRPARWRFLGALVMVWIVCVALTLFWARIQDGEMLYYNAWFNHSIFFVLALIGAIAVCDVLETLIVRPAWRMVAGAVVGAVCLLAGGQVGVRHKDQFRCSQISIPAETEQAGTILRALREQPNAPRTKLLLFSQVPAWEAGTGIAILLERMGFQPRVTNDWNIMFGDNLALHKTIPEELAAHPGEPLEVWWLMPGNLYPKLYHDHPLIHGYALQVGGPDLDAAAEPVITFADRAPNIDTYALYGWTHPDTLDATWVWTLGKAAALGFHALAVPAGSSVEMTYDCFPTLLPGKLDAQRLGIHWNSTDLGTLKVSADTPVRVVIPAALWNAQSSVLLRFDFPDAFSPAEVSQSPDTRQFALGSRKLTFHLVAAPSP